MTTKKTTKNFANMNEKTDKKSSKSRQVSVKTKNEPTANKARIKNTQTETEKEVTFPIVGIGASAGGLEAFTKLLHALPVDLGMAYVFVQHLHPQHESALTSLLSRETSLPVDEIIDGMKVEANHIYIIPPNAELGILHGKLLVMPRDEATSHHLPIDSFLRFLAEDQGSKTIGIILSGTASDGVMGLKSIKAEGGITFAQDEKSAKYDGMPHSAITAGCVDFVLPPDQIAVELTRIAHHPYVKLPRKKSQQPLAGQEEEYGKIIILLRRHTGIDFTYYKQTTIQRRIQRRVMLHKLEHLKDYRTYLQNNTAEVNELFQDILINVTDFFRDPDSFVALKENVYPALFKDRALDTPVRIWVPGCSTGEEAYSIVITLLEYLGDKAAYTPIQLFATDIDETVLEKARVGIYQQSISQVVSPERLQRFFNKVDGGYQIKKSIRELCVFAKQNVIKDPPFSRVDFISCRNLLIYLGPVLQKRVITIFHYALIQNGFLFLSTAETIGDFSSLFKLVDQKSKIYLKKYANIDVHFEYSTPVFYDNQQSSEESSLPLKIKSAEIQKIADQLIMRKYAPAAVVVNEKMEVLQFRGQTGTYLEHSPGVANLNLFKMCREGVLPALNKVANKALKDHQAHRIDNVRYKHNGIDNIVDLEVTPLNKQATGELYYLVVFEEHALPQTQKKPISTTVVEAVNKEIEELRHELTATKEYLQSVIEQQESSNEELQSANEEIQSSNEELQSINEELETAKEELQSTNEELATVNDELESRNTELTSINNDHTNLVSSVNIAFVMVGNDLCVKSFTPQAKKLLNLIPSDIGRPITDIKANIHVPKLKESVLNVVETINTKEFELMDKRGHWYSVRIRPYKTEDNKISGAVITFIDINDIKQALTRADSARVYAEAVIEAVRYPLLVLDKDLRVISVSQAYMDTFQVSEKQTTGNLLYRLGNGQWGIPDLREKLESVLLKNQSFDDFPVEHLFNTIGEKNYIISGRSIPSFEGSESYILMQIVENTTRDR